MHANPVNPINSNELLSNVDEKFSYFYFFILSVDSTSFSSFLDSNIINAKKQITPAIICIIPEFTKKLISEFPN